jgi:transcription initiation factor TFIIE subunit beta
MSFQEKRSGGAFRSSLAAPSNKRKVGDAGASTPVPAASPAPSQASTSSQNEIKRKRPPTSSQVYSQPRDTGTGKNIMTQVTYAIEYLKLKGSPMLLEDLLSYLSLQYSEKGYKRTITEILTKHEKVAFDPSGAGGKGTYSFRPIHNIRNGDQLLGYLQAQRTAQGLNARELRDGWANSEEIIRNLERQKKLLVTRNKKDDYAKMIWPDDPTLNVPIEDEFRAIWSDIRLPGASDLIADLEKAGLTPTNKAAREVKLVRPEKKKTKRPRKGGKITNTHMEGILRDFSAKRR